MVEEIESVPMLKPPSIADTIVYALSAPQDVNVSIDAYYVE